MKTKIKTIIMFILVFTGITLCYSVGWADSGLLLPTDIFYTCSNCGPAADKRIEIRVSFKRSDKLYERIEISAKDITDPKNLLKADLVENPSIRMNEIKSGRKREYPVVNMGSDPVDIIIPIKNYPVIIACPEPCSKPQVYFINKK